MGFTYSGLNNAKIKEYHDYLTMLNDGFLFNLDFDKIKFTQFNGKTQILDYLSQVFGISKSIKNFESEIKNIIYGIFRKIINFDFKVQNITKDKLIEQILADELGVFLVDDKLVKLIKEMYDKSSFLTRLDLMSIKGIKREDFKSLIFKELGIEEESSSADKKVLKIINNLFDNSLNLMQSDLKLSIPKQYIGKNFKSLDEFIEFAFYTSAVGKKGYLKIINCAILKTMSSYNQIMDNPVIGELNKKIEEIITKIKEIPGIYIFNEKNGEFEFNFNHPNGGIPNHTRGKIVYRTKDDTKILLKLLYNRKYSKLDYFKDLLGFRIEVDDEKNGENAILLFKDLFTGNCEIDNKGFIKKGFIDSLENENKNIKIRNRQIKAGVSKNFTNTSLTGSYGKENCVPFEIQFVRANNKNESGYSKHEIYDLKKYISAISRIFGYITLEQIKILVHNFGLKSGLPEKGILHNLFSTKKGKKSFLMKAYFPYYNGAQLYFSRDVYDDKLDNFYNDDRIKYGEIMGRKLDRDFDDEFNEIYKKYIEIKI